MKKLLLSTSLVLLGSAAFAADLPMQAKAPVLVSPAFSWTGCYVGAHVGGGTMVTNGEGTQNGTGAIAGGQVGCNYQDGNWVFGAEGEGSWSGIKAINNSTEAPSILDPGAFEQFDSTSKNKYDFSIAARAGIAFERTLIYAKGGWVWGQFNFSGVEACCGVGIIPETFSAGGMLNGLLVGVGIEHALTRNWTIKAEYNYLSFGSKELTFNECIGGVCAVTGTNSYGANKQIFKVGANYLFDVGGMH